MVLNGRLVTNTWVFGSDPFARVSEFFTEISDLGVSFAEDSIEASFVDMILEEASLVVASLLEFSSSKVALFLVDVYLTFPLLFSCKENFQLVACCKPFSFGG